MKDKIQKAFNGQVNAEFASAYIYLSMSSCLDSMNLVGMAIWMRAQAQEEMQHAMKFYDFILERDGRALMEKISSPKVEWDSALAVFEDAYAHECKVSGLIHDLVDLAVAERDHASNAFLQWFVTEQVEEEATVLHIVERLRMIGDNKVALLMMDNELGSRTPAVDLAAGSE